MFVIEEARDEADREVCFRIRFAVFVDEQGVPEEEELDAHDETALHLIAMADGRAVGTARAVPFEGGSKIGRVAVLPSARGKGLGAALVRCLVDRAEREDLPHVVLDAQMDAMGFYERLGFVAEGGMFDDAGIPHRRMRLVLPAGKS